MEFTVKTSTKARLNVFVDWLKKRAEEPAHTNNRDLIADFLEKVVVVELKRLENEKDEFDMKVDIPDSQLPPKGPQIDDLMKQVQGVIAEAYSKAGVKVQRPSDPSIDIDTGIQAPSLSSIDLERIVESYLKEGRFIQAVKTYRENTGLGLKESKNAVEKIRDQMNLKPSQSSPNQPASPKSYKTRTGNNHSRGKKRPLNDSERNVIESLFLSKNGNIDDKDCSDLANQLGLSYNGKTPWQVTGYVSELHRRVADGRLTLSNPAAYNPPSGKSAPVQVPAQIVTTPLVRTVPDPRKLRMRQ